ncbi:MAG: hypothetical protein A2W92_13285 [Bacteroidetes bacterium GWA2_42_15]|nr:MAG: hypothetical protein A2W92_13285 [Bacteroidetes bacterium GWA2_42_15]
MQIETPECLGTIPEFLFDCCGYLINITCCLKLVHIMKHRSLNRVVFVLFLFYCLNIWSCKLIDESYDPDPVTVGVSEIMLNSARVKCKFNQDKTWVRIKTLGCCWSTSENPSVNDEKIEMGDCSGFDAMIEGLKPDTKYYVRAYAVTSKETFYGNILEFKTIQPTVKDVDGNLYNLFQPGDIVITAKNLEPPNTIMATQLLK